MRGVYPRERGVAARHEGSSPLARGLRPAARRSSCPGRIIPACAGFTSKIPRIACLAKDHPRLRGVYGPFPVFAGFYVGSSPLARGLRSTGATRGEAPRIIPACAGFTGVSLGFMRNLKDHPRLRGVYPERNRFRHPGQGSSPLARGLRPPFDGDGNPEWIIPACAGFTSWASARRRPTGDHPRLRGVYWSAHRNSVRHGGSSPLARGLLGVVPGYILVMGIIPACAGFTSASSRPSRTRRDHPRLRGVYARGEGEPPRGGGSSPLARGLRLHLRARDGDGRIIPACAGFTPTRAGSRPRRRDHPRLRGVYHWERRRRPSAPGIIPACAGFTSEGTSFLVLTSDHPRLRGVYECTSGRSSESGGSSPLARGLRRRRRPRSPRPPDHPRLRGVYGVCACIGSGQDGSSPLARGLPPGSSTTGTTRRIIPACAGFTGAHRGGPGPHQDHPRLRGVYDVRSSDGFAGAGSSPLARGLRPRFSMLRPNCRIIPACAGFTANYRLVSVESEDHPRLRGVYSVALIVRFTHRGSSPLARGLLHRQRRRALVPRIIPACAGFTMREIGDETAYGGSSPLARGLRRDRRGGREHGEDHPRLRGVYADAGRKLAAPPGSSPLARGLRRRLPDDRAPLRIIPACAGFTGALLADYDGAKDHPRLRGVYLGAAHPHALGQGSSPLARGLLLLRGPVGEDPGIIPACAGFTASHRWR